MRFRPSSFRRPSEFQRAFLKHFRNDCYLLKRDLKQAPLTRQVLETMFTETEAQLLPAVRDVVREFIQSPDGCMLVSETLAKLDWSEVRKFFESSPKARSHTLGERTEEVFRQLDADRFDPDDGPSWQTGRFAAPIPSELMLTRSFITNASGRFRRTIPSPSPGSGLSMAAKAVLYRFSRGPA